MSKPIDLKTVNIFEPLKKKPSFENKVFNTLNADEVYEVLSKNSNETVTLWFKLQQSWCNNAYSTFKDYDSYLILIYLVNQVFQKYSDRFQYLSFQEFYEKNELNIDKINLIEISKELNIPKETIRRKVNFLQNQNIILGGDFNIIPAAEDVYNPKSFEDDALFRLEIRKKLREMINLGFNDVYRHFNETKEGYTFWDYMRGAWQKNNGMRIDHFLVSSSIIDNVKKININKDPRGREKPSDHTPIEIELA